MSKTTFLSASLLLLFSCSTLATDGHYILDPPNHNLRGHTSNEDEDESICNPVHKPDGSLEYQCVVFKFGDYSVLLKENERLKTELKSCQEAHP